MRHKGLECLAALGQAKNTLDRNGRSVFGVSLVFEWEIILDSQKSCCTLVREEYVDLLWKFPYLWELTDLEQGWCDSKDGQRGSSAGFGRPV